MVYDDRRGRSGFRPSWGFSCLVELEGRRLLFDAGGRDRILLHNLREAGVDPSDVELVVVSHDHDDHTGGLPGLLDGNPGITVFASPSSGLDVRRVNRVRNREEVVSGVLAVERPNNVSLLLESEEVLLAAREPGKLVELVRWVCDRWEVETVIAGFCRYPGAARIREVAEVLGELGVGRVVGCHYFRPSDVRYFERWGIECERPGVGEELEL